MMDARHLVRALVDPGYAESLDDRGWTALLAMAQAERLTGSLSVRCKGLSIPDIARDVLDAALVTAETGRTHALWEAEMAQRALAPLGIPVILLKGTAFVAAGLDAGRGRMIGDCDILVPRDQLDAAEAALLAAGWEWVKPDPYDDAYYRLYMHELPPLIHASRDRMIDVHHTILPLTARTGRPDAAALIAAAVPLSPLQPAGEAGGGSVFDRDQVDTPTPNPSRLREGNGLLVLSPEDMLIHAAAHLFADGDLAGGLRNLWDIDRLIHEHSVVDGYWQRLVERARVHGLVPHVSRALRLAHHLFETPVDAFLAYKPRRGDVAYMSRLLARDEWGRETRKLLRLGFYVRSHWIRMPPFMLARHLWTKWRKGQAKP
jgi:hypothetical protein